MFPDRKSTRLNSSHLVISYAVFCLKKNTQHPCARRPSTLGLTLHIAPSYNVSAQEMWAASRFHGRRHYTSVEPRLNLFFFFKAKAAHRFLHPSPTRRSPD